MCKKVKIKPCHHCSESFEARRSNHRYCSDSCRVRACYKRKGYIYVSGHYQKPKLSTLGEVAADSLTPSPVQAYTTPTQVPSQAGSREKADLPSQGMSGSGLMESVLGAGMVAASKYLLHDLPLIEMVRELHEALIAKPRRLQQQTQRNQHQMGMGMLQSPKLAQPVAGMQPAPKPNPSTPLTPHQLNLKRLGLDPKPLGGKDDGMSLM